VIALILLLTLILLARAFRSIVLAIKAVLQVKPLAIGLAAGIIIDATIIRALLVPALMCLLGDANPSEAHALV
jgi:putative drug exporter of the RND superfamily